MNEAKTTQPKKQLKVTIYTTSQCPYCQLAKNYLKEHGIAYSEKNVEDETVLQEMMTKTDSLTLPVIDIDGTIISGFDEEAIKKALENT